MVIPITNVHADTNDINTVNHLLITEVLYDAPNNDDTEEWIELYNPTGNDIDLTGWTLNDYPGSFSLSGIVPAGSYFIIARNLVAFQNLYPGLTPDLISGSILQLSNSGDYLELKDDSSSIVDMVAWEEKVSGWTIVATNNPIYRKSVDSQPIDTDTVNDWAVSSDYGNPGTGYGPVIIENPVVEILNPTNQSFVVGIIDIECNATDPDNVTTFELYINNTLVSTEKSFEWNTTTYTDGNYTILAKAEDSLGNWGEILHEVQVFNNPNPIVKITNPTNGSTASGPRVLISVEAKDPDGIASYQILINNTLVSSTKTFNWNTTAYDNGTYIIKAIVEDSTGNSSETSIMVTVYNIPLPPIEYFKFMSYNVEESGTDPSYLDVIKEENPDIMVLVETGDWDDNNNAGLNSVINELNTYFTNELPYEGYTDQAVSYSTSGVAILSRYEILEFNDIHTLQLDSGTSLTPSHDFAHAKINLNGQEIHVIGNHLKCCDGESNEIKRENAQEGIINYIDDLGDVPVIYAGDFNSFSPEDTGSMAPVGNLGTGPIEMLLDASNEHASEIHNWMDVYRTLNPDSPGYSYPSLASRIDFIFVNDFFFNIMINSTVGDTASANTGSDHYSVDAFFGGTPSGTIFIPEIPNKVIGLQAVDITNNSIQVSWIPNRAPNIANYTLYRDGVLMQNNNLTSFIDTNLRPLTTYEYQVKATDEEGDIGPLSAILEVSTYGPPARPPTVLGATAKGRILIDWDIPTDINGGEITKYSVYRSDSSGTGYVELGSTQLTMYLDNTTEESKTYYYVVTSHNIYGESENSQEMSITASNSLTTQEGFPEKALDYYSEELGLKGGGSPFSLLFFSFAIALLIIFHRRK